MKHTNLTNEIHGYHHHRTPWYIKTLVFGAGLLVLIALPFLIADYVFGAEAVTNWMAGV